MQRKSIVDWMLGSLEEVDVKLWLSVMKPVDAHWMVELYNHMTTGEGKNIESGWRTAGVQDAIKLGLRTLPSVDPFSDIDPMLDDPRSDGQSLDALCDMSQEEISVAYLREQNEDDSDGEWEMGHGAFDAICEIQDEFDDE